MGEDQLNGGRISRLTENDWEVILPYLEENERPFGIRVRGTLLRKEGREAPPEEVYRKIEVRAPSSAEESAVDEVSD